MALVLPLLPLLLWRVQGDPLGNSHYRVSLDGRPGERVNLSCAGVSQPVRWVWAPSFPACRGLPKGRHRILSVSASGTPTDSPASPFAGRLRALDHLGIRRLELLLSAGDSGTFICRGRREEESHTVLRVLGDAAGCGGSGPRQGAHPHARRGRAPDLLCPPHIVPRVTAEPQRPAKAEEPKAAGDLDQESSLLYADLDRAALRRPCQLSPVAPADSSTIYAVVV
uniref:Megakaryocyte and platelet inhibitory receptor G6b n=1 Tax=Pipistrellus kuhlii TaxID=59472 RepID=A0A7J7YMJ9_PIPKU|nr:megakaryocyte and platelet inhibitory receptor G6b [Pipistrellus kuhlii]